VHNYVTYEEATVARSDLLLNLVKAGTTGDLVLLRSTIEALAAEERSKQHHVLAERLLDNLKLIPLRIVKSEVFTDELSSLLLEITPSRQLEDLFLSPDVISHCKQFIEEQHRRDELRSHNLEPRHKILLAGPPGNGKTSLAEAIAEALYLPLLVVRYEGLFGSYLGETSKRLNKLLEYTAARDCVLFFDEFESIGKERNDPHELGEVKRLVSSLLVQIDRLPSNVIVVAATNHPETLDRAVWRRFEIQMELPMPTDDQIQIWVHNFENRIGRKIIGFKKTCSALKNHSFADIELFTLDVHRRLVLADDDAKFEAIIMSRIEELSKKLKRCSHE